MTLEALFARFRNEVDDLKTPYLWTDSDLEAYFNWALEELAKRTMYFFDQSTWASLSVTASDAKLAATGENHLDRILVIRRATLGSTGARLTVLTMGQADEASSEDDYGKVIGTVSSAWETQSGVPSVLITNYYDDGSLRLGPIPSAADTVSLWAFRLPLRYVSYASGRKQSLSELVGVREYNHEVALLHGMKAQAYLKEDPETRDDQLAVQVNGVFDAELEKIRLELQRRRHPTGKVRYGGL